MGYDISDYRDIYPPYGTLQDHRDLIDGLHERGWVIFTASFIQHN